MVYWDTKLSILTVTSQKCHCQKQKKTTACLPTADMSSTKTEADNINISALIIPNLAFVYKLCLLKKNVIGSSDNVAIGQLYFIWVLRHSHTRGEIKGQTSRALKKSCKNQTWRIASQLSCEGTHSTLSVSFIG